MARQTALAAGVSSLFARPLVSGALLMCRLAALASYLALFVRIHRSKPAVFFCHVDLPQDSLIPLRFGERRVSLPPEPPSKTDFQIATDMPLSPAESGAWRADLNALGK